MLRSSSLGIVLVSGVLVVSGSRQPDRASPEEGYQLAISKFRQGALDESLAQVRRAGALVAQPPRHASGIGCFACWKPRSCWSRRKLTDAQNLLENDLEGCRKYARAEIRRRVLLAKLCLRRGGPDSSRALRLCWRRLAPWLAARRLQDFVRKSMSFAANCSFAGTISIRRNEHGGRRNSLPNSAGDRISVCRRHQQPGPDSAAAIAVRRVHPPTSSGRLQVWRKLGAVQVDRCCRQQSGTVLRRPR